MSYLTISSLGEFVRWRYYLQTIFAEVKQDPGGTPYNGLYGEAPPERGTFFRLQVHKRVGISLVVIYGRAEKSVISVGKKAKKGITDAFYGCQKKENLGSVIYSHL